MAYGAILGQTPILTADGITYDNSKTSGLITGNNVQDAIDQTVGKLKTLSSRFQWVKLGERTLNHSVNFNFSSTDIFGDEKFIDFEGTIIAVCEITGQVKSQVPNTYFEIVEGFAVDARTIIGLTTSGTQWTPIKGHTVDFNDTMTTIYVKSGSDSEVTFNINQTVYGLKFL